MTNLEKLKSMSADEIASEYYEKDNAIWISPRRYCAETSDEKCGEDCHRCLVDWFNSECSN